MKNETKCGFVAILGAPNVGKSTLVNTLVGAKISIVSPKVQTTRSRIRGILQTEVVQVVLVDVPGIFKPKRRLDRAMVASAWSESNDADIRLLLVDAKKGLDEDTLSIVQNLQKDNKPTILVINKIDLVTKKSLLPLIEKFKDFSFLTSTFLISAHTGENIQDLKSYLIDKMPKSAFMFPRENLSDLPNRLFSAEITREKLFLNLQQELPYALAVETTDWKETDKSIQINQTIYIEREGQKAIIIGKRGTMLKKIGSASRLELSQFFSKKVSLFLFVKVKSNWGNDPERYKEWGLDFNA